MLARITVLLPFLALLAKAITVTSPTEGQNWGTTGAQTVAWNSVESDPSSFTVLLVNDRDQSVQNVLVANQSTSAGSVSVSPPSGSWTTGQAYRINLVRSGSQLNSILAQSGQFNVTSSGSAGSSAGSSSSSGTISIASSSSVSIPSAMTSAGSSAAAANTMTTSAPYSGNAQPSASGVPAAAPSNGATSSSVNKVVLAGLGMISVGYLVGA